MSIMPSTAFVLSLVLLLASAAVAKPTLLRAVKTMVENIVGSIQFPLPDLYGKDVRTEGISYTYYADFSCMNGTLSTSSLSLNGAPKLTGNFTTTELQFNVSIGGLMLLYGACEENVAYPNVRTYYLQNYALIEPNSTVLGLCKMELKKDGESCSTSASFHLTNTTAIDEKLQWWNDCPGCLRSIKKTVDKYIYRSMSSVFDGVADGGELCFFLDKNIF